MSDPGGHLHSLPLNFGYVVDGALAGCATPLMSQSVDDALGALREEGIRAIVSLDEHGLPEALADEFGLEHLHCPIADFHAPSIEQVEDCVGFMNDAIADSRPVVVHCHAGQGRTGTILACYLVRHDGLSATDAIQRIRTARPGSIETSAQERLIADYAASLRQPG